MTSQPEAWRTRQSRVLTNLREATGRKKEDVAHDANLTYWRYVRFEDGKTSLPAEHIPGIAHALQIEPLALIADLGLAVVPEPSLSEMLAAAGMPEDERRQVLSSVAGEELTPEEKQEFVNFWHKVRARRDKALSGHRRRA